ncbi:GNAT family N-acetyltransferase [Acetobacteraceae bacterium KSS8]|uniref:GNAT family N-acetyltransferase n=1 Tax=Endosaccharibacter trunci TaxID=2812733 RepID=A0ABT1W836_9PROT|nr:GNAT family N-acetyltransferase [Acetobacteraceae bacterium KSS8]
MASPLLHTERLILRPPERGDLDGWAAFSADPAAMRFLGGPIGRPEAWRSLTMSAGCWALQGFGMFSVLLRETGDWIGRVGPIDHVGWPAPEIGYGVLPAYQGRGYAREAVIAAAAFAFDTLHWPSIAHVIDPENAASIAVARSVGSRLIGPTTLPPPLQTRRVDLWGQSVSEWRAKAGQNPISS